MADIITEISLPSKGLVYGKEVQWQNQLRAPRLKDRGLADTTRRFKLQANILDNTLVQPLGISAYDLHTVDFTYLNMRQRQLSKGAAPYKILVKCSNCGKLHKVDVDLANLEIKTLKEKPNYMFEASSGDVIEYTFITPRILDDSIVNALAFREEYPDCDLDDGTLKTQEFLRLIIKTINGKKLTYAQLTNYISEMYIDDIENILKKSESADWGIQFRQELKCDCGKTIIYDVPTGY